MADVRTKLVRIREDLADKLIEISDVTDESVAEIADPILRDPVNAKHEELKPAIRAIKKAREKHRAAETGNPVG